MIARHEAYREAAGRGVRPDPLLIHKEERMRFKCIEFSWRAAFIGLYLTPERDKLWVTIVPFFPLYFKREP